ncbi:MAG TPA: SDR family NAD(P)-dependent oxidoreductase [Longilinea sp.]|nr:SDR family NAD(P)-dependent oxidoreductase [Longilinea sp.]
MILSNKTVLITGSARRIGRHIALALAQNGADILVHHAYSPADAESLCREIRALGRRAEILQADLSDPTQTQALADQIGQHKPVFALINNAAIFEPVDFQQTDLAAWQRHLGINLTAPFVLSKAFAGQVEPGSQGRIINILDWRAMRPGADHFPYSISKAALAALTQAMAVSLAPAVSVNGLAFGAVLPPSDGGKAEKVLKDTPIKRLADLDEVSQAIMFLLTGPAYMTGDIIYLDGGRHLV